MIDTAPMPDQKAPMSVIVDGTKLGEIDSTPLYRKRWDRAWRSLNPATCLEPSTVLDCKPFEVFLTQFSDSCYASQAREVIENGRVGMQRVARQTEEEEAWGRLYPTLCSDATALQSVSEAEAGCDAVERHIARYIARYPRGIHAAEASEVLQKGRGKAGERQG